MTPLRIFSSLIAAGVLVMVTACASTSAYRVLNPAIAATVHGLFNLPNNDTKTEGTLVTVDGVDGHDYRSPDTSALIDPGVHTLSINIQKNYSWAGGGNYTGDATLKNVNLTPKGSYQLVCECASPRVAAFVKLVDNSTGNVVAQSEPGYLTRTNMGGITIIRNNAGQHEAIPR